MSFFPTVAAISTPFGKGGIAVIRISGEDALAVADKMFRPISKKPLSAHGARLAIYGSILHLGEIIDTGIATIFRAPASFTGEDTVEIACHGGILLTQTVLQAALVSGAQPAGPGEFTKRAFLSGKLSLTEAEGVIDLIDAESEDQIRLASSQARGRLRQSIDALIQSLTGLIASTYAYIDYPDEDLTDVSVEQMQTQIDEMISTLDRLISTYASGKAIKQGVKTVLCGKPNVGKSSLLNLLLGTDRAIVTDVAGTTRDTVEESASLGKVMLRLCDTAGIRETKDTVEQIGVARSIEKIEEAELLLGVFDASSALEKEDFALLDRLQKKKQDGNQVLLLLNKSDLSPAISEKDFPVGLPCLTLSAKNEDTIEMLRNAIEPMFIDGTISLKDDAVVTNARQHASLVCARDSICRAKEALLMGMTQDLCGMDLEIALSQLKESDGRETAEDIVSDIFSRFCVGK